MLDERKAAILRTIVEAYIQTAQPVGSTHVGSTTDLNVSSATIRNDMVVLERDGFLAQPHTSSGRIPTEKGYRFFVDHLAQTELATADIHTVHSFFDRAHLQLEQLLADTSRLLSNVTSYAAVVVGPPHEVATVRSVQLVRLSDQVAVLVLVLSNGAVERRSMDLEADTAEEDVQTVAARLAAALVDHSLSDIVEPPPSGAKTIDGLVAAGLAACRHIDPTQVYVGGASKMATAFSAIETVRAVLTVLEEQYVVVSLLRDTLSRGLNVAIGTETGVAPLAECALVVAPYLVDGQSVGSIGVLGPTRMNYSQALAAVAVVSNQLGERLRKG